MAQGLQRAAQAAKRTRYPDTPEVAVRQVWADNDERRWCSREVTVLSFGERTRQVWRKAKGAVKGHYEDVPYRVAVCSVTIGGKARRGTTAIDVARFFPTATGYRYLRTLPAAETPGASS